MRTACISTMVAMVTLMVVTLATGGEPMHYVSREIGVGAEAAGWIVGIGVAAIVIPASLAFQRLRR